MVLPLAMLIAYLMFSVLVGLCGSQRRMGFTGTFLLSLVITPVLALVLLLIDRHGSMTPFHGFVDHVMRAIRHAGRVDDIRQFYFHDVPGRTADPGVLEEITDPLRPDIDGILRLVQPIAGGLVYCDPALTVPQGLSDVLEETTPGTAVVIVSDAGAARQSLDTPRLLNSVALIKSLRSVTGALAWLNPVAPEKWNGTTAEQVARHVPMFPLTKIGLNQTVDVLRGRPALVERPL